MNNSFLSIFINFVYSLESPDRIFDITSSLCNSENTEQVYLICLFVCLLAYSLHNFSILFSRLSIFHYSLILNSLRVSLVHNTKSKRIQSKRAKRKASPRKEPITSLLIQSIGLVFFVRRPFLNLKVCLRKHCRVVLFSRTRVRGCCGAATSTRSAARGRMALLGRTQRKKTQRRKVKLWEESNLSRINVKYKCIVQ